MNNGEIKVETKWGVAEWSWDEDKVAKVKEFINQWIINYEIFHEESLHQCDDGLIYSPDLVYEIIKTLDITVEYNDN